MTKEDPTSSFNKFSRRLPSPPPSVPTKPQHRPPYTASAASTSQPPGYPGKMTGRRRALRHNRTPSPHRPVPTTHLHEDEPELQDSIGGHYLPPQPHRLARVSWFLSHPYPDPITSYTTYCEHLCPFFFPIHHHFTFNFRYTIHFTITYIDISHPLRITPAYLHLFFATPTFLIHFSIHTPF